MKKFLFLSALLAFPLVQGTAQVEKVGQPILLVDSETKYMNPLFSPDGRLIAITEDSYNGITIYSFETNSLHKLTDDQAVGFGMAWSGDSKYIAGRTAKFEKNRRYDALAIYDVPEGSRTLLSGWESHMPGTPCWGPADRSIYFTGADRFHSYLAPGHEKREATINGTVIYVRDNKIFSRNAMSEKDTRIDSQDGTILNVSISPDRSKIAYKIYGGNLWISDIDGNNQVDLGTGYEPSWNPGSDKIVYMVNSDNGHEITSSDIFVVEADGTGKTNLTETNDILEMNPNWSPDGKWIVYDNYETGQIWLQEVR